MNLPWCQALYPQTVCSQGACNGATLHAGAQFDFEGMHALAVKELTEENDRLMADYVNESMSFSMGEGDTGEDGTGEDVK